MTRYPCTCGPARNSDGSENGLCEACERERDEIDHGQTEEDLQALADNGGVFPEQLDRPPPQDERQAQIEAIEQRLGWTEHDAINCGCNIREEPCDRCWSLGWAIGGIGLAAHPESGGGHG